MKFIKLQVCLLVAVLCSVSAFAHKPLISVDDNEDGTIYVEVGYSDGSSGAGHDIILKDMAGKVLEEVKVPDESSLDMQMPKVPYTVTFSGGPGHMVTVDGPFSEQSAQEEVAEEQVASTEIVEQAPAVSAPASVPAPPVVSAQPVVLAAPAAAVGNSPGFNMALKMMMTTNIIIAVFIAFLIAICAFGIGYSIGKSKK